MNQSESKRRSWWWVTVETREICFWFPDCVWSNNAQRTEAMSTKAGIGRGNLWYSVAPSNRPNRAREPERGSNIETARRRLVLVTSPIMNENLRIECSHRRSCHRSTQGSGGKKRTLDLTNNWSVSLYLPISKSSSIQIKKKEYKSCQSGYGRLIYSMNCWSFRTVWIGRS